MKIFGFLKPAPASKANAAPESEKPAEKKPVTKAAPALAVPPAELASYGAPEASRAIRAIAETSLKTSGEIRSSLSYTARVTLREGLKQIAVLATDRSDANLVAAKALADAALKVEGNAGGSANSNLSTRRTMETALKDIQALVASEPSEKPDPTLAIKTILAVASQQNARLDSSNFGNTFARAAMRNAIKQVASLAEGQEAPKFGTIRALADAALKVDGTYQQNPGGQSQGRSTLKTFVNDIAATLKD